MKRLLAALGLSLAAALASAAGSSVTSTPAFVQSGTGSVARTISDKLRDELHVKDKGADTTGAADATAKVQAAIDQLPNGGRVKLAGKLKIAGNLTVKKNVTLDGDCIFPGTPGSNAGANYGNLTCGVLMVASTATISMQAGAGLRGVLIYRDGMTFPAADATGFAGTAITAAGDDVSLHHVMVLGFNKAFYSTGYQRPRIEYFYGDNINGIEIANCLDVPYIAHAHMWPFATMQTGAIWQNLIRAGKAYYLHDTVDWAKISDAFSWGYLTGFDIQNANSATLLNVGADNAYDVAPLHANSIGISISGTSTDTRILGAQTAAQASAGIYVSTAAGVVTRIQNHNAWGGSAHGTLIDAGDVQLSDGAIRDIANAITVASAASNVSVGGYRFKNISGKPVNVSVASTNVQIRDNDYGDFAAGNSVTTTNHGAPTLASADPLNLPATGSRFLVSGTTSFGSLGGGWAGREVSLVFSGSLSVYHGGAGVAGMNLPSSATFNAVANSTLTLIHDGAKWQTKASKL